MPIGRTFLLVCAAWITAAACAPGWSVALAAPYSWKSVTVGGGGFSPNIVFSRAERGLVYLRTDIGGLYRRDSRDDAWIPLQDSMPEGSYFGIESVAPDPVNPNVVYAAAGENERSASAILRSRDRGAHWDIVPVPFHMGGNEAGRGLGERLAVDPNATCMLYFGSRNDGLQRSVDCGQSWSAVAAFPHAGRGPRADDQPAHGGIAFVLFDCANGGKGAPSRTIFAAVAEPAPQHLFRSDDAGKTWRAVAHEPRPDLLPVRGELDARGDLFIAYANGIGPNGVTDGAVYRLDTHSEHWTDITPDRGTNRSPGGYMGLSVDRQAPGTIVVATLNRNRSGDTIWRSTDSGDHWKDIRPLSTRDVGATPFLLWGEKEANFGWWMAGLAVDPFDSNHAAYTTGATVYATQSLTSVDREAGVAWRPWVKGVEETAAITLSSPPSGAHLLSGFGDISGFVHDDLSSSPPTMFANPIFANTNAIDYAGAAPNVVVRSGTPYRHQDATGPALAYSLDGGHGWVPLAIPAFEGTNEKGDVEERRRDLTGDTAIVTSADGGAFIVATPIPLITRDRGQGWSLVKGLPAGARPVADRTNPRRFYALDFFKSQFYVSNDGGANFAQVPSSGLPPDTAKDLPAWREIAFPLMATPGKSGDLWFLSRGRLLHSTDGGATFREVQTYMNMEALAFGKAPDGSDYPALFTFGWSGLTRGIWRSDDIGKTWLRINDDAHQYGRRFRSIAGDPRVFGRVYVGTDGRGILYGEPSP